MIFVNRRNVRSPDALIGRNSAGVEESKRAIQFYSLNANQSRKFEHRTYKIPEVRDSLERLFRRKCAYCESKYSATMPVEVEHWRPKGRVATATGLILKPGYFWLAAKWQNLLPSCIDCNRSRRQFCVSSNAVRLVGKADSFPLIDEARRARQPGEESRERPLLLNPCSDRPAKHIEFFLTEKREPILRARADTSGQVSAKGEASIRVLGLNRRGLVVARKEFYLRLRASMNDIERLIRWMDELPVGRVRREVRIEVWSKLSELKSYRKPHGEYSALAREMIRQFRRELIL